MMTAQTLERDMKYTLKDDGYPFKKIMAGKKWIGRVAQRVDNKTYIGVIGKSVTVQGCKTEREAFEKAVSKHCGYDSPDELRDANRARTYLRRKRASEARYAVEEVLRGNFEPFGDLLEKMTKRV
jgi:hypothetical protein